MLRSLGRRWTIHLLHHTHVDIGYTHAQDEVLKKQFAHLERAMELCEASRAAPEAERFRWNPEVTWAISAWLREAQAADRDRFVGLVREGLIGLDALYGNMLTGLCRPEELLDALADAADLEALTGVPVDSAMITDVPGWTWGLVTALAERGVKYLSAGPNRGDRIGTFLSTWGDRPFYWESPSGKERVLAYVHGKGYSWFHGTCFLPWRAELEMERPSAKLKPGRMRAYLRELEKSGYPYDSVIVRYNIGCDNGPPDALLAERVRAWNGTYPDMRLEVSTTSRALRAFESAHGAELPVFRGDLTGHWEDGAASTARETAMTREASERISQAADLRALQGGRTDGADFRAAREEVLLFDEHTWGSHDSMRKPDGAFCQGQWQWKRDRAVAATFAASSLLGDPAFPPNYSELLGDAGRGRARSSFRQGPRVFTVHNSHSWAMSGLVRLRAPGNHAFDSSGRSLATQRLSDGSLAIAIPGLAPFSSLVFQVEEGQVGVSTGIDRPARVEALSGFLKLGAGDLSLVVRTEDGVITSLSFEGEEFAAGPMDRLRYRRGRGGRLASAFADLLGKDSQDSEASAHDISFSAPGAKRGASVRVLDEGPLVARIRIDGAPSHRLAGPLSIEIEVEAGGRFARLLNRLERPRVRGPESLFFEFPFALDSPALRYDTAFGSALAETDQLPGACRNYLTATRWVDLSSQGRGVGIIPIDAPLFQTGGINTDAKRRGWLRRLAPDANLRSYVMNNYWGTNYRADQPGPALFRYLLSPHRAFDEAAISRFAREAAQPLIVVEGEDAPIVAPIMIADQDIQVTSLRAGAEGLRLRLYNASTERTQTRLEQPTDGKAPLSVLSRSKRTPVRDGMVELEAYETVEIGLGVHSLSASEQGRPRTVPAKPGSPRR